LTEDVTPYPAANAEARVRFVLRKLMCLFQEEENATCGKEEEDGAHEVGKGIRPLHHPLNAVLAPEERVGSE
jgi:hypothetical protein